MDIPEVIAALAFFGAIVICPLVYMIMKHQRAIAELIHGRAANEALQRLDFLEREVRELRAERDARVLRDDDRRGLGTGSQ